MEKFELKREIEKPAILYHGSINHDINEFTPRQGRFRDKDEGAVIFSTPDKGLAAIFLIEGHNDDWTNIGKFNGIPYVVIQSNREDYIKNDKGGTIYDFSSDDFECDQNKGMGTDEWVSRKTVKPTNKVKYDSVLNAMLENNVQVYFVDKETFKAIENSDDYGFEIIKNLQSENQRLGKNHHQFE
jgi:hypothetical protein